MRSVGYARIARQVGLCRPFSFSFGIAADFTPTAGAGHFGPDPLGGTSPAGEGYCVRRAVATACVNSACMAVVISPSVVIAK